MRKIFYVLLICVLVLALWGCTSNQSIPATSTPGQTTVPTSSEIEETAGAAIPVQEAAPTPVITVRDAVPIYDTQAPEPFVLVGEENSEYRAAYVHLNQFGYFQYANGVFLVCAEPLEMNQGNHYMAHRLDNGQITSLDTQTFCREYTLFDRSVQVEFAYTVWEGEIIFTYVPAANDGTHPKLIRGISEKEILLQAAGTMEDGTTGYALMLLDIESGDLRDWYAGMDDAARKMLMSQEAVDITFLDESHYIFRHARSGGSWFYVDLAQGLAWDLADLIGTEVDSCSIMGKDLVCWNLEGQWNPKGDFWKIHTSDMTATLLLRQADVVFSSGAHFGTGCSFILYQLDDTLHVFDFRKETDTVITIPEGWDLENLHPSPCGRKFYTSKADADGILQLLIFDCDRMGYLALCRENHNEIQLAHAYDLVESLAGWTEDGSIYIYANNKKDVYIYEFKDTSPAST